MIPIIPIIIVFFTFIVTSSIYIALKRQKKNSSNNLLSDHGLAINSIFPMSDKQQVNHDRLVLFLSDTCLTCLEIIKNISEIKNSLAPKVINVYLSKKKPENEEVKKMRQLGISVVEYPPIDEIIYKTKIFPFAYYLSKDKKIISKGAVSHLKDIQKVTNNNT
ncbi:MULTISPECIES: hypothetical protein [Paenibacillus]|uniref:Thioredoxin domain-containing protein n=1 Tax=Paenibacillus borealis TaxID=160799 RepID=A0ABX3GW40_PAEBO|nr:MULTISPECIES: hypothetical protein [Paenibacillus]AIQ16585.1 hypothetical protein H70357_07780 [Paenibacillus sp. FSL H7-0357]OMD36689.1 hypothetical protein BSK56_31950 [Paenibacillus borealis]